jgi:hypothetical protein
MMMSQIIDEGESLRSSFVQSKGRAANLVKGKVRILIFSTQSRETREWQSKIDHLAAIFDHQPSTTNNPP